MYEYKVIEAPRPTAKGWFGLKKSSYAETLSDAINEMALDNWEFQHAELSPKGSVADLLVFRRQVAKVDETLPAPRSLNDRMQGAERRHEDDPMCDSDGSRSYEGPVRPRRARIIGDAGPITERPKTLTARAPDASVINGTARRVTPMKPQMAAAG